MPSSPLLLIRVPTRYLHPTRTSAFHGRDQWTDWTANFEAEASSLSGSTSLPRTANGGVARLLLPGGRIREWLLIISSAVGPTQNPGRPTSIFSHQNILACELPSKKTSTLTAGSIVNVAKATSRMWPTGRNLARRSTRPPCSGHTDRRGLSPCIPATFTRTCFMHRQDLCRVLCPPFAELEPRPSSFPLRTFPPPPRPLTLPPLHLSSWWRSPNLDDGTGPQLDGQVPHQWLTNRSLTSAPVSYPPEPGHGVPDAHTPSANPIPNSLNDPLPRTLQNFTKFHPVGSHSGHRSRKPPTKPRTAIFQPPCQEVLPTPVHPQT